MIKATDLRVGNPLNYHTAEGDILPSKMDWQDFKWIDEDEKGFNLVHSAIPISEILLIKAGFVQIDKYTFTFFGFFIHKRKIGFTHGGGKHKIVFQGIHHLQNVFYFTRGKELFFEGLN
jgi:hypothetical protein